jgi:hypothetical protein
MRQPLDRYLKTQLGELLDGTAKALLGRMGIDPYPGAGQRAAAGVEGPWTFATFDIDSDQRADIVLQQPVEDQYRFHGRNRIRSA